MFVLYFGLGLLGLAFLPGAELLAALVVWLALLFAALAWFAAGDAAVTMSALSLVPLALGVRMVRLRVAARLW